MDYAIGRAAEAVGLSADTLRYYEKAGIVPRPARTGGRRRVYAEQDLARLRFVKRAQAIGFSLLEIKRLLKLRENPVKCSRSVRELAAVKVEALRTQVHALEQMERELALLLSLCTGDSAHCPILERLDAEPSESTAPEQRHDSPL